MKVNFSVLRDVDSSRVFIQTNAAEKDGLIFIRPGVPDVSIGDRNYAQVRIVVDEFFVKGVAVYSTVGIPDGYDIVVFTKMSIWELMHHAGRTGVIKKLKTRNERTKIIDRNNPFGTKSDKTFVIEENSNIYIADIDFEGLKIPPIGEESPFQKEIREKLESTGELTEEDWNAICEGAISDKEEILVQ